MTRQELINAITEETAIHEKSVEKVLASFMNVVKNSVAENNPVQLVGFGTFELRSRAERESRNPQTGETLKIPAKKIPAFKPGKAFKEIVNK